MARRDHKLLSLPYLNEGDSDYYVVVVDGDSYGEDCHAARTLRMALDDAALEPGDRVDIHVATASSPEEAKRKVQNGDGAVFIRSLKKR